MPEPPQRSSLEEEKEVKDSDFPDDLFSDTAEDGIQNKPNVKQGGASEYFGRPEAMLSDRQRVANPFGKAED